MTKLVFLLLLWLGAYATLMVIFTLFGERLNTLPLALRVLIVSGILTLVMSQVVFPLASRLASRSTRKGN